MIAINNKINNYPSLLRFSIIIALLAWFLLISFLVYSNSDISYLLIMPSLAVLLLSLLLYFHYAKEIKRISAHRKVVLFSKPALLFGLYLFYAAVTLGYLASTTEDYIYGYGYLFSYFAAYINVLLIYSFFNYFPEIMYVNNNENIVCLIGYYAAVIILIYIAYSGMDKFLTNQRFEFLLKASGIGLLSLPVIFYPIAFKWNLIRSIFFIFAIFMLFKSDSRSAILGALVGATVIYLIRHTKYFILTVIISTIIIFFMQTEAYQFLDKILLLSDKYRGISGDFSNRRAIWEACWNIFLNHPIIGVGFRMSDKILNLQSFTSAHNVYLMILMETGLIGTIIFLISIIMCLVMLGKKALKNKDKTSLFYIGLLIGTLVFGIGERFLINVGNLSSILLIFALFHATEIRNQVIDKYINNIRCFR